MAQIQLIRFKRKILSRKGNRLGIRRLSNFDFSILRLGIRSRLGYDIFAL